MKKEKSRLSVWYWGATPGYYLRHPFTWIKELFINIRNARDRMTKGYCSLDWYNFDHWFTAIAPKMLRDMADHGYGYPGHKPFETREDWCTWLYKMADQLDYCNEDWCFRNKVNEYQTGYYKLSPFDELTLEEEELLHKYQNRELDIYNQQKTMIQETLSELGHHWYNLWD